MEKCETCKHWRHFMRTTWGVDWGVCSQLRYGAKTTTSKIDIDIQAQELEDVDTTADFGCALWEKKE